MGDWATKNNGLASRWAFGMIACAALFAAPLPLQAMSVSPMAVELNSSGTGATARIQVLNINKTPLPYEVRVYRIEIGEDGNVVETPADADFIVFPPQGLIKQNQRQMVRVQWVGGKLDSSRGYYVAINQIPVPLDPAAIDRTKRSVDVQLIYHMKVLATVAPPGAKPKIVVETVRPVMISPRAQPGVKAAPTAPVPGISATITNSGKRYAMLAGVSWTIEGKGLDKKPLKVVVTSGEMGQLLGAGYVPALNGRRTFEVPTGVPFSNAPITIKFSN